MTSTFDKIYANAQNMNIETSEWFNRAGFFWCQCTEKQLQKMRLLLRAQGCKTIMRDDGEWFVLKSWPSWENLMAALEDHTAEFFVPGGTWEPLGDEKPDF